MRNHTIKLTIAGKPNSTGLATLYLRASRKRRSILIAVGEGVKPKDWDERAQRVKSSHKNSEVIVQLASL